MNTLWRLGRGIREETETRADGSRALPPMGSGAAFAQDGKDITVGVSWSNFQEERWKTDEAAIKKALEAAGAKYISADAQSSAAKQLTDVESLITQGANALIILAQDSAAIGPAVQTAVNNGIPVVGYDRLIENPDAFYITFDNKEVGRIQAREVQKAQPEGNYAFIKGSSADPNADFLFSGQMEVLKDAIDSGKIKNVGEAYTDGWLPANAQQNMEQILTANNNDVDAVVARADHRQSPRARCAWSMYRPLAPRASTCPQARWKHHLHPLHGDAASGDARRDGWSASFHFPCSSSRSDAQWRRRGHLQLMLDPYRGMPRASPWG